MNIEGRGVYKVTTVSATDLMVIEIAGTEMVEGREGKSLERERDIKRLRKRKKKKKERDYIEIASLE